MIEELLANDLVVGVSGGNDSSRYCGIPYALSEPRLTELIRVESVGLLNEFPSLSATGQEALNGIVENITEVVNLEVLEGVLGLCDHLWEGVSHGSGVGGGLVADGRVRVHPPCAGGELKAVEVVVELPVLHVLVGCTDGVNSVVH